MIRRSRCAALLALVITATVLGAGVIPAGAAASDQQIANAGVVVAGDVPATWASSPASPSSDRKVLKIAARTKGCKDYAAFLATKRGTTNAASDGWSSATGEQISNDSYVYKSKAAAAKALTRISGTTVAECLSPLLTGPGRDTSLAAADLGNLGVPHAAYQGTITMPLEDGSTQQFNIGLIAVQLDRAVLTYSIVAPPEATEIQDVVATVLKNTAVRTNTAQQ